MVIAARAGCTTIDACLAHLPDPFECFYGALFVSCAVVSVRVRLTHRPSRDCNADATKRSVGFIDDSTPMITVAMDDDNSTNVVVVVHEQQAALDRRGWVLFVVLSLCLCTPVCCLLGVVSVLEGVGISVPCRFDDARCAVRQRLDRLQRPTPGSPSAHKGKWGS